MSDEEFFSEESYEFEFEEDDEEGNDEEQEVNGSDIEPDEEDLGIVCKPYKVLFIENTLLTQSYRRIGIIQQRGGKMMSQMQR